MTTLYDLVRYPNPPVPETHPSRLAAQAALCGRDAAPVGACRVLELGCGNGANIASMAAGLPGSTFVGIDLAESQIALGRTIVEAAGLANVTLLCRDITGPNADLGPFDYVVAHGVYAWVPDRVREAFLPLVSRVLAPDGMLYVSYNAHPGCRLREALRDIIRDAARGLEDPGAVMEATHAALRRQIAAWSDDKPFQSALKKEAAKMLGRAPAVLFHDELNPSYAPQLVSDVVLAAGEAGLEYLCDAHPPLLSEAAFPSDRFAAALPATGGDWVRFEQMLDHADMRPFRRSVFVRPGGEPIDRRFSPSRLMGLHAAAEIREAEPAAGDPGNRTFQAANKAEFETADGDLIALMRELAAAWPCTVPLSPYAGRADMLEAVGRMYVAGIVFLDAAAVSVAVSPGPKPLASRLARAQLACGERDVSSCLHRGVQLDDDATRDFLQLLDGSRTQDELAVAMATATGCGLDESRSRGQAALARFGRMGLLVA